MSALDFLLNCAALLLLLNWWSRGFAVPRASGIALVSTLRRAGPARKDRWRSPVFLVSMLIGRAFLYWQIGSSLRWMPRLSLVAINVPFRSDSLPRMLLFSLLSFLVFVAGFYFCLLLISAVNRKMAVADSWQSLVHSLLGFVDRLPLWIKLPLPFFVGVVFWLCFGPILSSAGVHVPVKSFSHRAQEAALIGIGAWTTWKYALGAILVLHMVTSYVYLGNAPIWNFVTNTAKNLLRPLSILPLRFGRFDLAPVVALVLVFALAELMERWLPSVYAKLPL